MRWGRSAGAPRESGSAAHLLAGELGHSERGRLTCRGKLARGPAEPPPCCSEVAWERAEPRAPSLELLPGARAASPGLAGCFPAIRFPSSVRGEPGTKELGGRGRVWRALGVQPRALLVLREGLPITVLFIPALLSLHRLLDRRAFFLSFLVLPSVFCCMVNFLPDWDSFLKNTACEGIIEPLPFK